MKKLLIIADGMADLPISSLAGRTPLEVANTPFLDRMCIEGATGMCLTVPNHLSVSSEVANMSILGYSDYLSDFGRAYLEAISMGVEVSDTDIYFRCNFVNTQQQVMVDHTADNITTDESSELIDYLNQHLYKYGITLYKGQGFKNIAVVNKKAFLSQKTNNIYFARKQCILCTETIVTLLEDNSCFAVKTYPPHEFIGNNLLEKLPKEETEQSLSFAKYLSDIMNISSLLLANHPVNIQRESKGLLPATEIWLWSKAEKISIPAIYELKPDLKKTAMIAGVDVMKGIGRLTGMEVIEVKGADGTSETNYEGKVNATLKALERNDFVCLHIEAPDEASHSGSVTAKVKCIEDFDLRVIKPIYEYLKAENRGVQVTILPDHITSCEKKIHVRGEVPILKWGSEIVKDKVKVYNESSVREGSLGDINAKNLF